MNDLFNNIPINITERASVPRSFDFTTGFNSADRLKRFLWDMIHNEKANRELYFRLLDAGLNRPVLMRDQAIELLPGKFIKVYLVLKPKRDSKKLGSFGVSNSIIKESRITLYLFADLDKDMILWTDKYLSTIDHELTHAFQSLDIAIRYLYFKNRKIPNYTPSFDDAMKWLIVVDKKNSKILKKNVQGKSGPLRYLDYISSDREVGAMANALLRELYSKDRNLFDEVISFCEHGWPTFETIDTKLSRGKWHGWEKLTSFGHQEMRDLGMRYEETNSYALKHELLEKLYMFYETDFKRRIR